MKRAECGKLLIVVGTLLVPALCAAAGTLTRLNEGDPWQSWSCPRINNLGEVALVRSVTTSYSGAAYLWTGSWSTLVEFPGTYVDNQPKQPKLEFNDNGRIAFRTSGEGVRVADTTGVLAMGAAPYTLNYAVDINGSNQIAAYAYVAWLNNRIYTSDDPYTDFTEVVGPADIITFHVEMNDNGQVAWKPPANGTLYRYTPGVGNEAIGPANWAPFDMDNAGRVLHVRDQNKIMLNDMVLRQSAAVWQDNNTYAQPRISDNGRHVVWTEYTGSGSDLYAMVDGVPTNLTEGGYGWVYFPDVNDAGQIVFSGILPGGNVADVYLYESDDPRPIVYNGHFEGKTLFGWDPVTEGSATIEIDSTGGAFSARLTSGSPAALEQAVDVPAGSATLAFDFDFLTANGTLTVTLGGVVLAQLTPADDAEAGFTHVELPIATTPPLGEEGAILSISLAAAAPSTVLLDNVEIPEVATDVDGGSAARHLTADAYASPNPFRAGTTFHYGLAREGRAEVAVYDVSGRLVRTLFDGRREVGPGALRWDGRDRSGRQLPPGVYFIRLRSGETVESKKVHLVR